MNDSKLVPLLVVRGASDAIAFYCRALGATVLVRYEHGAERRVSHAELAVGDVTFAVTEEARAWNSDAPSSLGGSAVVMQLRVTDTDAAVAAMSKAGAAVVFPTQELFGERMARVRDPFGHLWLLLQRVRHFSPAEIQRQRDELFARFATGRVEEGTSLSEPGGGTQVGRVHLLLGPVGAGKSTLALRLSEEHRAVRFALDDWMVTLFRLDRPATGVVAWYIERAARCVEQIWKLARAIVESGTDVVLELGLLLASEREQFYARLDEAGVDLTVHVVDAAREVRRERVLRRNEQQGTTFSMLVPLEVFEMASDRWQAPTDDECAGRDVRVVRTDMS